MSIKIATFNLCLGLLSKRDMLLDILEEKKLDVCCVQETEIAADVPIEIMSSRNYIFEGELNNAKKRVGIFIHRKIDYIRRFELEVPDHGLVIIDLLLRPQVRIITIYRQFTNPLGETQYQFFLNQLKCIEDNITTNTVLCGDFNLNFKMQHNENYSQRALYNELNSVLNRTDLTQIVRDCTWSRVVNNQLRESLLDHIYVTSRINHSQCENTKQVFGDHSLVAVEIRINQIKEEPVFKRDWKNYSTDRLHQKLSQIDWNIDLESVQEFWNCFEALLVGVVDEIAPLRLMNSTNGYEVKDVPQHIKSKINKKRSLLKKIKLRTSMNHSDANAKVKQIDTELRNHFREQRRLKIRRKLKNKNTKSLWESVKIAQNHGNAVNLTNMHINGAKINNNKLPDAFANNFTNKVKTLAQTCPVHEDVYNGTNKLMVLDRFFMDQDAVKECLLSLNKKKSEGFDRIPSNVIFDGREILLAPFTVLFEKIYQQRRIPEQWKVSKIVPIYKKGDPKNINNYRPIANLCSSSKVFEKLILKQIHYLESTNKLDFTGKPQHGFKRNKSTMTAGLLLQSIISKATDDDNMAMLANLDLSSAFDTVNVNLLLKRLRILGLPRDLVALIEVWLMDRLVYVTVNGKESCLIDLSIGTVQGSILGPILYAVFVSPLFDLTKLTNFADDIHVVRWNKEMQPLIQDLEMSIEMITKWLRKSGLTVNGGKTEICLFHRCDKQPVEIRIGDELVRTKKQINVLGVCFDSKMRWSEQVCKSVSKALSSLYALKQIKQYFTQSEMKLLLNSIFYSKLYFNAEIWLTPNLTPYSKSLLLSASARALLLLVHKDDPPVSYVTLHKRMNQFTPCMMLRIKHAILMYKIFNSNDYEKDWTDLNLQIRINNRHDNFEITRTNNYVIGRNYIINRLWILNRSFSLNCFNKSLMTFKKDIKKLFINYD